MAGEHLSSLIDRQRETLKHWPVSERGKKHIHSELAKYVSSGKKYCFKLIHFTFFLFISNRIGRMFAWAR